MFEDFLAPDIIRGFYGVTKPVHVYKLARRAINKRPHRVVCVVRLRLPVGAVVYADVDEHMWGGTTYDAPIGPQWRLDQFRQERLSRRKCRSTVAEVVDFYNPVYDHLGNGSIHCTVTPLQLVGAESVVSVFDPETQYLPGKTMVPHDFSWRLNLCAAGIHFFFDWRDALQYDF